MWKSKQLILCVHNLLEKLCTALLFPTFKGQNFNKNLGLNWSVLTKKILSLQFREFQECRQSMISLKQKNRRDNLDVAIKTLDINLCLQIYQTFALSMWQILLYLRLISEVIDFLVILCSVSSLHFDDWLFIEFLRLQILLWVEIE